MRGAADMVGLAPPPLFAFLEMTSCYRPWPRTCFCFLLWLLSAFHSAQAHDPFDGNIMMSVSDTALELKVTLGFDASRAFLASAGVTPAMAARFQRDARVTGTAILPVDVADRLVLLEGDNGRLKPTACLIAFGDQETYYVATYPRPPGRALRVRARYFGTVEYMRPGVLIGIDARRHLLASQPLTREQPSATVPLNVDAARRSASFTRFVDFFKLGTWHILTGFDHLLFLCALLLGVRKVRTMAALITAFSLAHSVTLALSALNLANLPPAIVEPLIALSIIAACIENVRPRDTSRISFSLAGGFGLIHGFGFAGALREAGMGQTGSSMTLSLLSFNLGVEAGQLFVAMLVVPVLLLARRSQMFMRWGLPGLSVLIILTSSVWLIDRLEPITHLSVLADYSRLRETVRSTD